MIENEISEKVIGAAIGGAPLRLDLIVERQVIVEIKAVDALLPIYGAQLLSYLRLTGMHLGLLINFNTPKLVDGVKRIVNRLP
jgi:GxxExxY protein